MIQLSLVTSQARPEGSREDGMSQAKEIDTVGPWVRVEFQEVGFRESRVEQWFLEPEWEKNGELLVKEHVSWPEGVFKGSIVKH